MKQRYQKELFKILKINKDSPNSEECYFIHYKGWKSKWNEWVDRHRLVGKEESNLTPKRSSDIRNYSISHKLIEILKIDKELITKKNYLQKLPSKYGSFFILDDFVRHCSFEINNNQLDLLDYIENFKVIFESLQSKFLLYRFEKDQFATFYLSANSGNTSFRSRYVYGPILLLRYCAFMYKESEKTSTFISNKKIELITNRLMKFVMERILALGMNTLYEPASTEYMAKYRRSS